MKKDKKPGQKPKEFASHPFGSLKGVRTENKAEPRKAAAPLPEPEVAPDEAALFLRAMGDAKRLHPVPSPVKAGKPALPKASRFDDEDRALFLQALENLRLDVTFRDELPEVDEPAARPLPINRLRQLKRGTIRLDFQLDLHGLTRDEGVKSLAEFIGGAYQRGQKAVLVITGKGNRSPGEPVLQGAVTGWLREKGKAMVAEFAPAPRDLGGSGALVVFLKEKVGE
jgi:DNA-nicking Smr family endonuclease